MQAQDDVSCNQSIDSSEPEELASDVEANTSDLVDNKMITDPATNTPTWNDPPAFPGNRADRPGHITGSSLLSGPHKAGHAIENHSHVARSPSEASTARVSYTYEHCDSFSY